MKKSFRSFANGPWLGIGLVLALLVVWELSGALGWVSPMSLPRVSLVLPLS